MNSPHKKIARQLEGQIYSMQRAVNLDLNRSATEAEREKLRQVHAQLEAARQGFLELTTGEKRDAEIHWDTDAEAWTHGKTT